MLSSLEEPLDAETTLETRMSSHVEGTSAWPGAGGTRVFSGGAGTWGLQVRGTARGPALLPERVSPTGQPHGHTHSLCERDPRGHKCETCPQEQGR